MTEIETTEGASRGLDRRTIIKGAAWSVPVVAAAVATPLAAATGSFDVRVQQERCQLVGLSNPPYFNIYADTGTVPTGSVFTLVVNGGLVNLSILSSNPNEGFSVIDGGIIGGSRTYTITTTAPITQGNSSRVDFLPNSLVSAFLLSSASLTYVSSPSGTESGPGKNVATTNITGVGALGFYAYSCTGS